MIASSAARSRTTATDPTSRCRDAGREGPLTRPSGFRGSTGGGTRGTTRSCPPDRDSQIAESAAPLPRSSAKSRKQRENSSAARSLPRAEPLSGPARRGSSAAAGCAPRSCARARDRGPLGRALLDHRDEFAVLGQRLLIAALARPAWWPGLRGVEPVSRSTIAPLRTTAQISSWPAQWPRPARRVGAAGTSRVVACARGSRRILNAVAPHHEQRWPQARCAPRRSPASRRDRAHPRCRGHRTRQTRPVPPRQRSRTGARLVPQPSAKEAPPPGAVLEGGGVGAQALVDLAQNRSRLPRAGETAVLPRAARLRSSRDPDQPRAAAALSPASRPNTAPEVSPLPPG